MRCWARFRPVGGWGSTKNRYDIFGSLPDTIEDDWIESIDLLEEMMNNYIHLRWQARDVFDLRYQETIDQDYWEL